MRAAALALTALLAAGCTTGSAAAFRAVPAAARAGGVLQVGITRPGSVDPGNDYEPAGDLVVRTMCDTLVTTDPRDGSLRPGLAESWIVTDGGSRLVLRLRKGLRFSDGTPLTAADVAYSLSRVASADYASASADLLRLISGYDTVHGDVETTSDSARRKLSGVGTPDKRTVEISLTRPYADFVRRLASPVTAPVSQRAAERRSFDRQPICAGPYRLAAPYDPSATSLRLVRSTAHVAAASGLTGGGRGYVDSVVFRIYPSEDAAAQAALRGEVDVASARSRDRAAVGPGPLLEYVGLPTTKAPFDRPEVRRALSLALSRTELIRRVFPGTRLPATGFLPVTTGLARSCDAAPANGDLPQAQAVLRAAGVDLRDVRVPLLFNDELRNRSLMTEVARQWRATVGLVAVPTPLPWVRFLAVGQSAQGFVTPFRWSWSAPDVDGYLTPLLSTDGVGQDNLARFSDPVLDRALSRRAWRAVDPGDRALAYRRVLDLACSAMPMIPLTESKGRYVVSARVASAAGTVVDRSTGQPLLPELYLR